MLNTATYSSDPIQSTYNPSKPNPNKPSQYSRNVDLLSPNLAFLKYNLYSKLLIQSFYVLFKPS